MIRDGLAEASREEPQSNGSLCRHPFYGVGKINQQKENAKKLAYWQDFATYAVTRLRRSQVV